MWWYSIRDFRSSTQRAAADRDSYIEKARRALGGIERRRIVRAQKADLEVSVNVTKERVAQIRLASQAGARFLLYLLGASDKLFY